MSRSGEVTLFWGDEERTFRLGIKEWEKVQEKCDAGPGVIHARLAPMFAATEAGLTLHQIKSNGYLGSWRVHDVREPIYRGLIGGGMEPTAAGKLVRDLVDERELIESVCIAYRIVDASIVGAPDEPMGELKGEGKSNPSPTESSPSQTSTELEPQQASARKKSKPARSGSSTPPSPDGSGPTPRTKGQGRQPRKSTKP